MLSGALQRDAKHEGKAFKHLRLIALSDRPWDNDPRFFASLRMTGTNHGKI
jgi:hypothetical protein